MQVSPRYWLPTNLTYVGHDESEGVGADGYVNSYDLFISNELTIFESRRAESTEQTT